MVLVAQKYDLSLAPFPGFLLDSFAATEMRSLLYGTFCDTCKIRILRDNQLLLLYPFLLTIPSV